MYGKSFARCVVRKEFLAMFVLRSPTRSKPRPRWRACVAPPPPATEGDRRGVRHERVLAQLPGGRDDLLEPVLCGLAERRQGRHGQLRRRPVQGDARGETGQGVHVWKERKGDLAGST